MHAARRARHAAADALVLALLSARPPAGYMVATTSAASPLSNKAQCGFAPFTTACSTMNSRVVRALPASLQ